MRSIDFWRTRRSLIAQILTEEMDIPVSEPITMEHFSEAHVQLLREGHTNIDHLITNIRRDRRFEAFLMKIASYDEGIRFSLYNEHINELATYGVIAEGADGMCEIINLITIVSWTRSNR